MPFYFCVCSHKLLARPSLKQLLASYVCTEACVWAAVPSNKRAAAVEHYGEQAEQTLQDPEGDSWVAPPSDHPDLTQAEAVPQLANYQPQAAAPPAGDDDDDIPDINDLELDEPEEVAPSAS